ncbi:MAG: GyrI-like domain-containing protein [Phycisphaerales bacterium]|nr:GyrI-like domain-containing protein [Phycisphaerales bacterium]
MNEADLNARLKELYQPPANDFVLVDVPEMRYIMIDGRGAEDRAALEHARTWLFAVIQPIRPIVKARMGKHFVEPPLECLWWADDAHDFVRAEKSTLRWRMMIVFEPDWLTAEVFDDGVAQATSRLGEPPSSLRLERHHEGLSAQIMFVGPNRETGPVIARLHTEFLPARQLTPNGRHHEIYLNDPSRVAPEKVKTVLRQPVRAE